MIRLVLFLLAPAAFGAVTDVQVQGTTSTQAIISYTAPTTAACTVEVSRESDYSPVVEDVNGTYYSGADSDNRAGNIFQGRSRIVVIGKRGAAAIAEAADGHKRSRALWADTEHYFRITCGGDTATGTFRTGNIPVGDTRGEPLLADPDHPYMYDGVTPNASIYSQFADPQTGTRIVRPTSIHTFGYGASSKGWPENTPADCNKTLTGVAGSCLFTDAQGTGWSATTGTLTDAVRTDDSNFAEYSGTTQQVLYIRMGNAKYPTSGTSEQIGGLAFQNMVLKVQTTDATGEGGQVELCTTLDGVECFSPWLRHTLVDTNEAIVRFCSVMPCTGGEAEKSGDNMLNRGLPYYVQAPNVKAYNESGTLTTLKFVGANAQTFCDSLYVNEYLSITDNSVTQRWNYITAKSCGSTPPQVTISTGYDYTTNGTAGVGVATIGVMQFNPRFGILVRKPSTTSGATLKVGYALWRMAVNTPFSFAYGSGGFGKRCQNVLTAQGEYLCHFDKHIVGISYAADGTLNMNNYGYTYTNGSYIDGTNLTSTGQYGCMGSAAVSDTLWDDETAGVFYCYMLSTYNNPATSSVDNRGVLVKMTLDTTTPITGDVSATGAGNLPGLSNQAPRLAFTNSVILTPCLAPCTATSDDYTPYGQRKRFNSDWTTTFNICAPYSIQGDYLVELCLAGSQDSPGWLFVYDLGNKLPIGAGYSGNGANTQQLVGGFFMPSNPACPWCSVHTFQAPMGNPPLEYTVAEVSTKCPMYFTGTSNLSTCNAFGSPGSCSACPNVTLDGYNYNGKNWCSDFTISSSWDGGWGSTPVGFESGDPVSSGCPDIAPNLHYWGQKLAVGDFIYRNGEIARIIEKTNNTTYKIIRGWGSGYDNGVYYTRSHSNGDTWQTRCGTVRRDPTTSNPEFAEAIAWWFKQDPTGTDGDLTYFFTYQNHAFTVGGVAGKPEYQIGLTTPTSASSVKTPTNRTLALPAVFSGQNIYSCPGNACEKHPAYGQILGDANAQSWFVDVNPRLSHGTNGVNGLPLLSGKTYVRKWSGQAAYGANARINDLDAYTGPWPFRRVDTITDSTSDTGKWCWAVVANDCISGTSAGDIVVVYPEFDTRFHGGSQSTCREAEFGSVQNDGCFGPPGGVGASGTQWRVPNEADTLPRLNGQAQRVFSRYARSYRDPATSNNKIDPKGRVLFERGLHYFVPPPFPGVSSKSGETFQGIPVTVTSVPAGTDNALVQFGYDHEFHCSMNRDNSCYAESAALNQTTPYRFDHETLTGVSCASGCTITIPAIMNRVVYWRMVYRNSGGTVIARGSTNAQAVQ